MPRVKVGPALQDRKTLDGEIVRLRDLDLGELRRLWQTVFRRRAALHLPRHVLFRVLAYRLQAIQLGDLDGESQRILDCSGSPEGSGQRAVDLNRRTVNLRPGTVLGHEWNGQMHRVAVLAGQARAKAKAVRPYLPCRPAAPRRGPSGNGAFSSAC